MKKTAREGKSSVESGHRRDTGNESDTSSGSGRAVNSPAIIHMPHADETPQPWSNDIMEILRVALMDSPPNITIYHSDPVPELSDGPQLPVIRSAQDLGRLMNSRHRSTSTTDLQAVVERLCGDGRRRSSRRPRGLLCRMVAFLRRTFSSGSSSTTSHNICNPNASHRHRQRSTSSDGTKRKSTRPSVRDITHLDSGSTYTRPERTQERSRSRFSVSKGTGAKQQKK